MKGILFCAVLVFITMLADSQNKTVSKTVKPAPAKIQTGLKLKTLEDSANYVMGLSVANFYKQQGVKKIRPEIVTQAINDAMAGKQPLLNDMQCNNVMMTYIGKQQQVKAKPTIQEGESFLATNSKKQGVTTTPSGLQYEVIRQGMGSRPSTSDTVVCNYKGTFLNGTEFDNSYTRGTPAEFPVTGVIRGWTEVLQLMPAGSKYKIYVPYQLGYGAGDYNGIPGGSMLIFEIELLSIKGK